jgi:phosphoglycerate kinase
LPDTPQHTPAAPGAAPNQPSPPAPAGGARGSFHKASVRDADVEGRRVLVRADFNVPLADGAVADPARIDAALPTIELLLGRGAALVLVSHLDRPKGVDPALSMSPVATVLSERLGALVELGPAVVGAEVERLAAALAPGKVLLLENSRFEPGETANDPELAAALARLADLYVNDAFGAAHRAHATTEGVARLLPAYAGLLLEREVRELAAVRDDPDPPLVVVLGGAKVTEKLGVIRQLAAGAAARILIGGAMCFSFFSARGIAVGDSLVEPGGPEAAAQVAREVETSGGDLRLPLDLVVADRFAADAERRELDGIEVPVGWMGLDVGPRTVADYGDSIASAGTIFWNGPMGAFELEPFAAGTRGIAEAVARAQGKSVVGGGDSAAALAAFGLAHEVDWLSTGGGAALELMEGRSLPGVEALDDA